MPILFPYSSPEGHESGFVDLNHEEGFLDITSPSSCVLIEGSKITPEILVLRCMLTPLPLLNKEITVNLISEGEVLEEAFLYNDTIVSPGYTWDIKSSQWQGIALEYTGSGRGIHHGESFVFHGKALPSGQLEERHPLYIKPFRVEDQSYSLRTTTLVSGKILTSPPGALNVKVLRGYGGYYQPGVHPADIGQVYYSLTSRYTQTWIRLYTTSGLHTQHTPPPHGGRDFNHTIVFSPHLREEEYLSLTEVIAAGYAHLSVSSEGIIISYVSYLCEVIPGDPTCVNVYFRP